MPALDVEFVIYARIREILEADISWSAAFDPANRIWYDQLSGDEQPEKTNANDGDFPEFVLLPPREGQTDLRMTDETFATWADEGVDWLERLVFRYEARMTSQLMGIGTRDPGRLLTLTAIRLAGPKLGLEYIVGLRANWTSRRRRSDIEGDTQIRHVTQMILVVTAEIHGSKLLGG